METADNLTHEEALARLELIEKWEKEAEVKDRFALLAYGIKRKSAWIRKKAILDMAFELKRRFKVVLFRYLEKRDDRKFKDMQDLILTFDKMPGYEKKFKEELAKRPKLSTFRQS